MKKNIFFVGWILLLIVPAAAIAEMRVECMQGCLPLGQNQTVDLLLRQDESIPVVIRWSASDDPSAGGAIVTLYAGNPAMQEAIADRGPLVFTPAGGRWESTMRFSGAELGRGTFLAVVTKRAKKSKKTAEGSNEEILDWRAFRLLTNAEKHRKEIGPPPSSEWSVTVTPALLQGESGHGPLPRSQGGDKRAWWSFVDMEGNTSDLDLDGDHSGIPGIGVQVSTPWHTSAGEDWKSLVLKNLTGVSGHRVRFGELEWKEQPDRTLNLGPNADKQVILRQYYSVITLYTNASVKTFDDKEVGADHWFIHPTYFSHETSARLKHTGDPRFWASYSRREHSADKRLLGILQRHAEIHRSVPGLGSLQMDDGDGGSPTYTIGFYAQVRPWEPPTGEDPSKFRAGLVGLDVVAARAGIGGLVTHGSAGLSSIEQIWCKVIRCSEEGHGLDLDNPPTGYKVSQPVVSLATMNVALPMIKEKPDLAERGLPAFTRKKPAEVPAGLPGLPSKTRFGIAANLRAGALLQEGSWGYMQNIVPINTYAQFVVKMTVAMLPETAVITNDEMIMPLPTQFGTHIAAPKPTGIWAWIKEHIGAIGTMLGLAVLLALMSFVPGLRKLLSAILNLLAQIVDGLAQGISKLIEKLSNKTGAGKP